MIIAGIDEAGRGPAVGPLVLAVAVVEKKREDELREFGARDSKELTAEKRRSVWDSLQGALLEFGTAHVQAHEIDALRTRNSLNEIEAMRVGHLLNSLKTKPEIAYLDSPDPESGNFAVRVQKYINFECILRAEHKADVNYPVVSAASIIAKLERDMAVRNLELEYNCVIGTGYSHDPATIRFIKEYTHKNNSLPHCARRTWLTSQRILDEKFQKKLFG